MRISGIDGQELHRTALNGRLGPIGTLGVDITTEVTVVCRVGVDENAPGSVLLREIDLYATEVASIADKNNLVLYADAHLGEFFEVCQIAVVGVDDFAGDVSRRRR